MSYPVKVYKRMGAAYRQALLNAPPVVAEEMEQLGVLIDSFAPFVGSGGFDAGDLEEIKASQAESGVIYKLGQSIDGKKIKKLFVKNGLAMVHGLALASFKETNDEGDLLLVKISDQCGLIATKAIT